jgi:putative ATP-dependent endonuclease of OLD family
LVFADTQANPEKPKELFLFDTKKGINMYLSNIKLWNFRKFGTDADFDIVKPNLDLKFTNGLNVLIGENNSGKTAIIDAIKLVLRTHSYEWLRINHEDFYLDSQRLRIELNFTELSDNEAKNFTEWLGWEGEGENAKPYLRLIYDVSRNIEDSYIFPSDVRAGVDESGFPLTAEAREYLKVTYLKPLRDAYNELVPRRNSRLSQILLGHEAFKGKEENHLLVELFRDFNLSVEKYFEGKENIDEGTELEDQKGKELKKEIDKFIHSFYSKDKESNFGIIGGNLKNILEKLELTIKDEINPGLGTLNRLFMATELVHLQKKNWTGLRLGLI